MKLALLSDLHLDAPFAWAGPAGGPRWRQALRDTLERAFEVAADQAVDAILLAGDIYEHDLVSADTANFLAKTLRSADPIPVFVAAGNHDYLCPSSVWTEAKWSPNVRVFGRDRWEAAELAEGLTLWGVSHGVPAGTPNLVRKLAVDRGGVHLALFHGGLRSAAPPGASVEQHGPFDEADINRAGISHAFVGHFHQPRWDPLLTYAGNPNPLSFGETGERGLVVATIASNGTAERTCHRVATAEMHDLTLDVTGARSSQELVSHLRGLVSGRRGAARITLQGELDPDVDLNLPQLSSLPTQLDAVVMRVGDITSGYDLDRLGEESTVRGQFVRDVLGAGDLAEDERLAVILCGLRALDGRDDLEVAW